MMHRATMATAAWRALSPVAQAIYLWLKLEWHGTKANNNGRLCISYRTLCQATGIRSAATVQRGFQDLQAKGFVRVTQAACLGANGNGRGHLFELTEHPVAGERGAGARLFDKWKGEDFPVTRANANNPDGIGKRQKNNIPSQILRRPFSKIETLDAEASQDLRNLISKTETQSGGMR
jgi:hypothetical protein